MFNMNQLCSNSFHYKELYKPDEYWHNEAPLVKEVKYGVFQSPIIIKEIAMKATLFAAVLAMAVCSLPTFATEQTDVSSVKKKINLNTADIKTLTGSFQRIGKQRAAAIIHYRQTHGGFKSVTELAEVHGLGQAFVSSHLASLQTIFDVK